MTYRKQPIIKDKIYHIFNRSIADALAFIDNYDYLRFLDTLNFYRYSSLSIRYSFFLRYSQQQVHTFLQNLERNSKKLVSIYAFCLMPTHFHFLLRGCVNNGIQKFARILQDSYAKYFNTRRKRKGSLFQEMFKANLVQTDEEFIHVARYIHLNPFSSSIVSNFNDLELYPWSSLGDYLNIKVHDFVDTVFLESFFLSKESHRSFVFEQAEYQKKLLKNKIESESNLWLPNF